MSDFGHLGIQDQARIGMNGARGLKAGVRTERRDTQMKLALTELAQREQDYRAVLNKKTQDVQQLIDEFL